MLEIDIDSCINIFNVTAQVTINILDVNDNDPIFQPDGTTFILVQLQEDSPRGTIVVDINAIDLDTEDFGKITYYPGDLEYNVFDLDQDTGKCVQKNVSM